MHVPLELALPFRRRPLDELVDVAVDAQVAEAVLEEVPVRGIERVPGVFVLRDLGVAAAVLVALK